MPKESQEKKLAKPEGDDNWHDHILSSINPDDERMMLIETRKRAKKMYGFTTRDLDILYGKVK